MVVVLDSFVWFGLLGGRLVVCWLFVGTSIITLMCGYVLMWCACPSFICVCVCHAVLIGGSIYSLYKLLWDRVGDLEERMNWNIVGG